MSVRRPRYRCRLVQDTDSDGRRRRSRRVSNDRASRLRTEGKFLPADQQGQEFYVKWHGDQIDLVKFEYRQINAPDKIGSQQYQPHQERAHVFQVVGDGFRQGGTVSGWRTSLWHGGQLVAELKSSLW